MCRIECNDSKVTGTKVTVSDKGIETLLENSELHNDEESTQYLRGRPNGNCRKNMQIQNFEKVKCNLHRQMKVMLLRR